MAEQIPGNAFTENQRRVVSVVLRQVEQMADSVLEWLAKEQGILNRVADDVSPRQAEELRALVSQLKEILTRLHDDLGIQSVVHSPSHTIYALLSTMAVTLEESQSGSLRGYGPVSEAVKARWDPEVDRMVSLLDHMMKIVSISLSTQIANPVTAEDDSA